MVNQGSPCLYIRSAIPTPLQLSLLCVNFIPGPTEMERLNRFSVDEPISVRMRIDGEEDQISHCICTPSEALIVFKLELQ